MLVPRDGPNREQVETECNPKKGQILNKNIKSGVNVRETHLGRIGVVLKGLYRHCRVLFRLDSLSIGFCFGPFVQDQFMLHIDGSAMFSSNYIQYWLFTLKIILNPDNTRRLNIRVLNGIVSGLYMGVWAEPVSSNYN